MENYRLFVLFLLSALCVGFVSVVFVLRWVFHYKEGLAWDGGLREFNWHPVLVVTGFIFIQGIAILVYRLPWTWSCSKLMMKFIHAGLNLLAFIFAVISLVAVFDYHNAANIPNMYSLHSWVGLAAVIMYALQLVMGACVYLLPVTPMSVRAALMPLHIYSGLFIFCSVIATALMGITEKLIFGLKDPKYKDSPPEAIFVNVLGLLILIFGMVVLWIVSRPAWKRPSEEALRALLPEGKTNSTALSDHSDPESSAEVRRRTCKQQQQEEE